MSANQIGEALVDVTGEGAVSTTVTPGPVDIERLRGFLAGVEDADEGEGDRRQLARAAWRGVKLLVNPFDVRLQNLREGEDIEHHLLECGRAEGNAGAPEASQRWMEVLLIHGPKHGQVDLPVHLFRASTVARGVVINGRLHKWLPPEKPARG